MIDPIGIMAQPVTMQDVRLHAGEGNLGTNIVLRAVNIVLERRSERARALVQLASDLREAEAWLRVELTSAIDRYRIEKRGEFWSSYGLAKMLADVFKHKGQMPNVMRARLDRRIHNQRRALRDNWEIVEQRTKGLRRAAIHTIRAGKEQQVCIEALVAQRAADAETIARLREALRPFANYADAIKNELALGEGEIGEFIGRAFRRSIKYEDFRRSRAALDETGGGDGA